MPTQLPIPHAAQAATRPTGSRSPTRRWPTARCSGSTTAAAHTRGSGSTTATTITSTRCRKPTTRSNDLDPNWIGGTIYFPLRPQRRVQPVRLRHEGEDGQAVDCPHGFPVLNVGSGGGRLIYEQAGYLHLFDPADGQSTRLKIGVASDLAETRPRCVKGSAKYIRHAGISPSGARAVFEFRGEIVTVPAEKGDPRNLTESPGVNDRSPGLVARRPVDRLVLRCKAANIGCTSGRPTARVRPRSTIRTGPASTRSPSGRPTARKSPTSTTRSRSSGSTWASGQVQKIASEPVFGPDESVMLRPAWSPDSKWIVYSLGNQGLVSHDLCLRPEDAASRGRSPTG